MPMLDAVEYRDGVQGAGLEVDALCNHVARNDRYPIALVNLSKHIVRRLDIAGGSRESSTRKLFKSQSAHARARNAGWGQFTSCQAASTKMPPSKNLMAYIGGQLNS